ncbi:MAG: hypothetical protein IJR61_04485, partial [Clostridia bacterium]|nr:hypothetical protein [Clostridia bacterium]
MKKKILSAILGMIALLAMAAACSAKSTIDDYKAKGYLVSVIYDANGGRFIDRDKIYIMDMFNPSDYPKNADGSVSIKLTEPTSPKRHVGGSETITLSYVDHFFVGWYKTRNIVKDADGTIRNEDGEELVENENGAYTVKGSGAASYPVYTYADRWDFDTDTITYNEGDGEVVFTLYPAWIKNYEFDYFAENENGEWEKYASTGFNYKLVAESGGSNDADTIWLPDWQDGAMNYTHPYRDESQYEFPKITGTTFLKAYTDPDCSNEIRGLLKHGGSVDMETGVAVNRVRNVYVKVEQGVRYKIETAEQLSKNGNEKGIYEILADLDFEGITWPSVLSGRVFEGEMVSVGGVHTISNVNVKHSSDDAERGGLFGGISGSAVIKDVAFTNITFDLAKTGIGLEDPAFGLLAGEIETGADISGVSVDGMFRICAV